MRRETRGLHSCVNRAVGQPLTFSLGWNQAPAHLLGGRASIMNIGDQHPSGLGRRVVVVKLGVLLWRGYSTFAGELPNVSQSVELGISSAHPQRIQRQIAAPRSRCLFDLRQLRNSRIRLRVRALLHPFYSASSCIRDAGLHVTVTLSGSGVHVQR